MQVEKLPVSGLLLIRPTVHEDARGYFLETWHAEKYEELGLPNRFVQDNEAQSSKGVLRGLHYQIHRPQGKLVRVVEGEVFDVAVDIRHGSPTFGKWTGVHLTSTGKEQLWVPPGFAHGYCVLSETAVFSYKCTEIYLPELERSIHWNDPEIGIDWPLETPLVSPRDDAAPLLKDAEIDIEQ